MRILVFAALLFSILLLSNFIPTEAIHKFHKHIEAINEVKDGIKNDKKVLLHLLKSCKQTRGNDCSHIRERIDTLNDAKHYLNRALAELR